MYLTSQNVLKTKGRSPNYFRRKAGQIFVGLPRKRMRGSFLHVKKNYFDKTVLFDHLLEEKEVITKKENFSPNNLY